MAEHSLISPSGAEKWYNCPGSAWMESQIDSDGSSKYADEGSLAHKVAENVIHGSINASNYESDPLYSPDMFYYGAEYGRYCWNLNPKPVIYSTEVKVDLNNIVNGMVGTVDLFTYDDDTETLHIVDYKYGMGVRVSAYDNKQMALYAYGILEKIKKTAAVKSIHTHIYQPRINNISTYSYSGIQGVKEFYEFIRDLADKANIAHGMLTGETEPESFSGKHCRFCKASGYCYTLAHEMKFMYGKMIENKGSNNGEMKAELLSEENFNDCFRHSEEVRIFINAINDRAVNEAVNNNKVVPGFKLVDGRSTRKWADEAKVSQYLPMCGVSDIYETKLKSPAQIEKLCKSKEFLKPFIVSEPGKPKLVPTSESGNYSGKVDYSGVFK